MKNKSHPQVTFKWSRVDEGLLLSAFYPDSQELLLDGSKISIISEHSKFFETFLKKKMLKAIIIPKLFVPLHTECIKSGSCSPPTGLFVGNGGKVMRVNDKDLFTKQ